MLSKKFIFCFINYKISLLIQGFSLRRFSFLDIGKEACLLRIFSKMYVRS